MAEQIDGNPNLISSGGHVWVWDRRYMAAKTLRSVGTTGAARVLLVAGEQGVTITGRDGAAILKGSGGSKADADADLTAQESAICELRDSGRAVSYEDDAGRSGDQLVVSDYQRIGHRQYGQSGGGWNVWQRYQLRAIDLEGGN